MDAFISISFRWRGFRYQLDNRFVFFQGCFRFGAKHIVYGGGLPFFSPGGPRFQVTYADISPEQKRSIAGGTLKNLLDEVTR